MAASPYVQVNILNNQVKRSVAVDSGTMGLMLTGVAVSGKIALNDPRLITSVDDAAALGLDAAYDTANSAIVYASIADFYSQAPVGTNLYIMLVASSVTLAQMADKTVAANAMKLITYAQGAINYLGFSRKPTSYTPSITEGIDPDVVTAVQNAQALAVYAASLGYPLDTVMEGRQLASSSWSSVHNFLGDSANRVLLVAASLDSDANNANVGFTLGVIANTPIQRSIGGTNTGVTKAYVGTLDVTTTSPGQLETLYGRGVIFLKPVPQSNTLRFVDSHMCCADTDDYAYLEAGRIRNQVHKLLLSYAATTLSMMDVPVSVQNYSYATIDRSMARHIENEINDVVNTALAGAISGFKATVSDADNILSTDTITVTCAVELRGVLRYIVFNLGLTNTL
jgi:hypothetical protein